MLLLLAGLACAPKVSLPGPAEAPAADLDTVLPIDPGVHHGVLDNGLRWLVEENHRPESRAELRLVVRAGSLAEDDDQRGIAHVLEHMAFNGTEHYPGHALIDTLESFGMEFGAHLNAYTSFDETVYELRVPTDDPQNVAEALRILRDQAGGILLDPEEIERERGVVLEEWRTDRGAGDRIYRALLSRSTEGSRYAERDVIGTEDSLRTFPPAAVERFYRDWYRPELMAVLVVGDVEVDAVAAQIAATFSDLENPAEPRPLPDASVPPRPPRVQVVTDPGAEVSLWMVNDLYDRPAGKTVGDYRLWVRDQVVRAIIGMRLRGLSRVPDSPVLGAGPSSDRRNTTEVEDALVVEAVVGQELAALELAARELRRLRLHGATPEERDQALALVAGFYEEYLAQLGTADSTEEIEELVRHVIQDETMPGTEAEVVMARRFLPTFTPAELDGALARWLQEGSELVQLVMPEQPGLAVPSEGEIRAVLDRVATEELAPPTGRALATELLAAPPESSAAKVASRRREDGLQFDVLTLDNGIELWLRQTDFEDDEVRLSVRSPGGLSLVPDEEVIAARMALGIARRSGVGELDELQLTDLLDRRRVDGGIYIDDELEGVWAKGPPGELELMLQLVVGKMTASRFTEEGLALFLKDEVARIEARERSEDLPWRKAMQAAFWEPGPRTTMWTVDTLDAASLDAARRTVAERFGNAADFRWFLVGDFEPAAVEPLLLRYLGALPTSTEREQPGPHRSELRLESLTEQLTAGTEPKARVLRSWTRPIPPSTWLLRNRLSALESLLSRRLEDELREARGGVYGVSVWLSAPTWPQHHTDLTISFTCAPERVEELLGALDAELEALLEAGPTDEEIAVIRGQKHRSREESERSNSFWPSAIFGALLRGEDPVDLLGYDERVDQLSPETVHAVAREVLGADAAVVELVQLPEPGSGP
jgi:zinc protease